MRKNRRQFKEKKRSISFFTTASFFFVICFFVGIYIAYKDTKEIPVSPIKESKRTLPKKIMIERDKSTSSSKEISLKPEELTFFDTLIAERAPEYANIPSKGSSVDAARKKKDLPSGKDKETENKGENKTSLQGVTSIEGDTGKKYKIQIASFVLRTEAKQMQEDLVARGYSDSSVEMAVLPEKGTRYRVFAGEYGTYEEAKKHEKEIRSREKRSTLIVLKKE